MHFESNEFYHVYNRGNNKMRVFFSDRNYDFFLKKIKDQILPFAELIAYCLMPNHYHLLLQPSVNGLIERNEFGGKPMQELPFRIGVLQNSYTQAINKQNKTTGSLFQQKTKSKILAETLSGSRLSYLEQCFHYIHQNPIAAGLVNELSEWKHSSFLEYAGLNEDGICNRDLFFKETGLTREEIIVKTGMSFEERIIGSFY